MTGQGVCRDYAHVVIALLRAMDVPARYAACYAPGLRPMDFHAVAEAYLDGAWYVIDAHPPREPPVARAHRDRDAMPRTAPSSATTAATWASRACAWTRGWSRRRDPRRRDDLPDARSLSEGLTGRRGGPSADDFGRSSSSPDAAASRPGSVGRRTVDWGGYESRSPLRRPARRRRPARGGATTRCGRGPDPCAICRSSGPKNRDHGDWASNAALKLAKVVGAEPARVRRRHRRRARRGRRRRGRRGRRPRLHQHPAGCRGRGRPREDHRRRRRRLRLERVPARQHDQPRVRQREPDGPDAHRPHAVGGARRLDGPTAAGERRDARARVLHQRRWRADGALRRARCWPRRRASRRPRTATRARTSTISPGASARPCRDLLDARRATSSSRWPATVAYELQLGDLQRVAGEVQRPLRRAGSASATLHAKRTDGEPSLVDEAVDRLREQGHVFDDDGAVWVRTTDFGDDRDRVIRRSNGEYTYFAADAAYYLNKSDRGFAHKIYLLGRRPPRLRPPA